MCKVKCCGPDVTDMWDRNSQSIFVSALCIDWSSLRERRSPDVRVGTAGSHPEVAYTLRKELPYSVCGYVIASGDSKVSSSSCEDELALSYFACYI